jgi:hypothetical protein
MNLAEYVEKIKNNKIRLNQSVIENELIFESFLKTSTGQAYSSNLTEIDKLKEQISNDLQLLKDMIIDEYNKNGIKKPSEGLGIRIGKELIIEDERGMIEWLEKNAPMLIKKTIDMASLKKLSPLPINGVLSYLENKTPTISPKLWE